MLRYPANSTTWTILRGEVADLNLYHLLGYTLETISDEEDEEDENKRVDAALETVRGWSAQGEWADGEEWIGGALCGLLCGDRTCFPVWQSVELYVIYLLNYDVHVPNSRLYHTSKSAVNPGRAVPAAFLVIASLSNSILPTVWRTSQPPKKHLQ